MDEEGRMPHQQPEARERIAEGIPDDTRRSGFLWVFDRAFQIGLNNRWQTAEELASAWERIMFKQEEKDRTTLSALRAELEGRPGFDRQVLTKRLYSEFMKETRITLRKICQELGGQTAVEKQGRAKLNEVEGEFGSHFGITIPGDEVYLRLHGRVLGTELVMQIEDDGTVLARLALDGVDWKPYRLQLRQVITSRRAHKLRGT